MRSEINELFAYLENDEIEKFREKLTTTLANTPEVEEIRNVEDSNTTRVEKRYYYLLYQAIILKNYEAFQCLLDCNVNLLQIEKLEGVLYERKPNFKVVSHPYSEETTTALAGISEQQDPILVQKVFDHICERGLYKEAAYLQFLIENLDKVQLNKFNAHFLQIDAGKPPPERFATLDDFKNFLLGLNIDLSEVFFSKTDYLRHLLDPNKNTSAELLAHALDVSHFDIDELKQIYESLTSADLKRCVLDFCPEVDADYLAELIAICAKEEERLPKKPKQAPSPEVPTISLHYLSDITHLQSRRIPALKNTIVRLSEIKKPKPNHKKQLLLAKSNLEECLQRYKENPYKDEDQDKEYDRSYKRLCK